MKASLDKAKALSAFTWHGKEGNSSGVVRLSADAREGTVKIESGSDNFSRSSTLRAEDVEDGEVALSVLRIIEQGKTGRKTDRVVLASEGGAIHSQIGRSKANTPVVSTDSMPRFGPAADEDVAAVARVDAADLKWLLKAAAAASDPTSDNYRSIRLTIGGDRLAISATNSYRMAMHHVEADVFSECSKNIIPAPYIAALAHMGDTIEIGVSGTLLSLSDGDNVFLSTTLDKGIPDISSYAERAAASRGSDPLAFASKDELSSAINGAGAGAIGAVEIAFYEDYLTVSNAVSSDAIEGRTETEIEAKVHPDLVGRSVRFNNTNYQSLAQALRTEQVALAPSDERPFLHFFESDESVAFRALLTTIVQR